MALTDEVGQAIQEIRLAHPEAELVVIEDGNGGANVIVDAVSLGDRYVPSETWIGFHITFQYPNADVYPHFVRGDLKRADGSPLGVGMAQNQTWQGRPAVQVSRRSNRLDPNVQTAEIKLEKVLEWIRTHP